jgi:hypothetical protein
MTTLVLQTVGSAIGGAIGGPIGSSLGSALGSLAGAVVTDSLMGGARRIEGPRLEDVDGLASREGAPIPRLYGRARLGGQIIWATRPLEVAGVERGGGGGKGAPPTPTRTTYAYFANLAVGLCEGPIAFVRRIWADGREIDQTGLVIRVHRGDEDQAADPLIVAKEGAGNAPSYRGLAYVVFERLPLAPFGNRIPQFTFEVVRPVHGLGGQVKALCLIPGSTEFGYDPAPVVRTFPLGGSAPENRNQLVRRTDVVASLDALQALCPHLARVAVVTTWFGDDLRAGECRITPRVEQGGKFTYGDAWRVGDLGRDDARTVSTSGGVAAYGGTPSDAGLMRLVAELRARGLGVALYPFVMMDVAGDNALPDPWTGAPSQPAHPWRGRITCDPAPGRPGSIDGTAAASAQVEALFGAAAPWDFAWTGAAVSNSGPDEWSLRRQVLHYARLAAAAGGVEAFVIGSELVGLTRVRDAAGDYPAVSALARLAGDVRAVLGPGPVITYAADWTEYGADVRDGGSEVRFPLDPLWAHPEIGAVGIDFYPPLTDWRDEPGHLDGATAAAIHDPAYLAAAVTSGEAFDWYYADEADRSAQIRRPIADGAYGKPWIYRPKDLAGWWSNAYVERSGGVETQATAWAPRSKPIWLTELGVPAVDKGSNGPNAFPDLKSAEGRAPPFSTGARDDLIQARALEALIGRFDDPAANPVSPVYGGPMVDPSRLFVWAWDARPFPSFPDYAGLWADGPNWETGHWLNGRIEGAPLDRLAAAILDDFGVDGPRDLAIDAFVDGYVIDRPLSARAALEPLARLFGLDVAAPSGTLRMRGRGGRPVPTLGPDDLVRTGEDALVSATRAQDGDLPVSVEIGFTDAEGDYRRASVLSRRLDGASRREARDEFALVMRRAEAQRLADAWLQSLWAARESVTFALSPRALALEPGDLVAFADAPGARPYRIERIADGPVRRVTARSVEPAISARGAGPPERPPRRPPALPGRPAAMILDLPLTLGEGPELQHLAVAARPWPGAMAVWRSRDGASFSLQRLIERPSGLGATLDDLHPGPLWRWDVNGSLAVEMTGAVLASVSDEAALAGENVFALQGPDGLWEVFAAARAELVGEGRWRLSRLLRGLGGSEPSAARPCPPGAAIVKVDAALTALASGVGDLGAASIWRIGPAGLDHADPAFVEIAATAGGAALRPLSPVRLSARREAGGVRLAWIRRTRRDGDSWEPVDPPLAEEREVYDVEILRDGAPVRTIETSAPACLYPAAQEIADFGAPVAVLSWRVAQRSALVGAGAPAAALSPLP